MTRPRPIRDRATFDALARARRHSRGSLVSVRFVAAHDDTPARVAIAPTRAVGTAVARNRVRRRLRAAIAAHHDELDSGAYLFGAGPQARHAPFEELRDAVGELIRVASEERT